ncbi:LOW QUALITY PROTEIN: esterase E4-like [Spodoptera litura]|uniref:Carboxylic ester hydrolase n=1 Tax=Spodoptera litura TaxID=69820 RepID=A0A9J7J2Z9_SPOLT|nr:LOW QUALITY PROTEIN: esterase E4-like [Spodoptera litura]
MGKSLWYLLFSLWGCVALSFRDPWEDIEDRKFESLLKRLVYTRKGYITTGLVANGYKRYMGVPYGLVNASNPFGPAEPYPAFKQTFYAEKEGILCPQIRNGKPVGITECLTMNIYVPQNRAASKLPLPVMVWIHGGEFVSGSAEDEVDNPTSLLRHGIIVVAVNYRLGIYGFMCLDTHEVPGNQGLKDQTLALRWIRDNIAAFGGDQNKITVFGQSAGGMSINMHLFSLNEKLFEQAIIQSGSALSYWMMVESDDTIPLKLAEHFGYATSDIHKALNHLRRSTFDTHSLVKAANDMKITSAYSTDQPFTKPCVEKQFEGVENFITQHPMNMISEKAKEIPIIIGHNANEYYFQCHDKDEIFFTSYDISKLFELGFNIDTDFNEAIRAVEHFYFGDAHIEKEGATKLVDFVTDFIFAHPTQRMAEKFLESGAKYVYRYVFSFFEASHGDELPYLFDSLVSKLNKTDGGIFWKERLLVKHRMVKLWTNFVKHGHPSPEPAAYLPFVWTPITNTTQPYLDIDLDFKMMSRPEHGSMAFWDLFYKLYGKFQKWYINEDKEQQLVFKTSSLKNLPLQFSSNVQFNTIQIFNMKDEN